MLPSEIVMSASCWSLIIVGTRLEVLVGGGAHPPAARPVVLAGDDEVMALAARRLDRRQAHAAHGQFVLDSSLQRPVLHLLQALADDPDGLEHLLHAHHHARPDVAAVLGDHVEIHPVVGGVGMVAPAVDVHARRARHRADQARRSCTSVLSATPTPRVRFWMFLSLLTAATTGAPLGLQFVQHLAQLGLHLGRDVPAHAADDAQRVGLAVAADLLRDPHDRLADAEALHEERVEADDVAGQPDPEQVAVQALDLQHDRADVFGARRRPQGRGRLDGLRVGHVVHAAADAADALRHHRDVVVGEDRLGELLDAAMHHEPAVLAAAHHLAFDVEPEMRRLVQRGMERPEGHHHAAFRRLVELELALLVVALRAPGSRAHLCAADARRRASRRAAPAASGSGGPPARCRPGRGSRARPSWRRARRRRCCPPSGLSAGR